MRMEDSLQIFVQLTTSYCPRILPPKQRRCLHRPYSRSRKRLRLRVNQRKKQFMRNFCCETGGIQLNALNSLRRRPTYTSEVRWTWRTVWRTSWTGGEDLDHFPLLLCYYTTTLVESFLLGPPQVGFDRRPAWRQKGTYTYKMKLVKRQV